MISLLPSTVTGGLPETVLLLGALADSGLDTRLWSLTRGAVAAERTDRVDHPEQAAVWGLGLVAALEHPRLWGGLVDLPPTLDETAADRLMAVLTSGGDGQEDQLAVRPTGVFVRRMVPAPLKGAPPARSWRPDGTVLITDGTGLAGAHVARHLARQGAAHLLLTESRPVPEARRRELEAELAALGATVTVAACDCADPGALAAVLAAVPERHPLTAVVHCAELLEEGLLEDLDPASFERVLRAKATPARILHELTEHLPLSAFVLFSSFPATFGGSAGLGAYAAAGAYLDALAAHRAARGLAATSIAYGYWAGSATQSRGAEFEQARQDRLRQRGLPALAPDTAVAALRQALDHDETAIAVVGLDWERFHPRFTAGRPSPLLAEQPEVRRLRERAASAVPAVVTGELARLPSAERERALLRLVRAEIAAVLGHADPEAVDARRGFLAQGMDSLTTVELANRLSAAVGRRVGPRTVLDAGDPAALAGRLNALLGGGDGGPATAPDAAAGMGGASPDSLGALFLESVRQERAGEFLGFLTAAARFRPVFGGPGPAERPAIVPLTSGTGGGQRP